MQTLISYIKAKCCNKNTLTLTDKWWNIVNNLELQITCSQGECSELPIEYQNNSDFDWIHIDLLDPITKSVIFKKFAGTRRYFLNTFIQHLRKQTYKDVRKYIENQA